ncbi:hypothetical protein CHS0354_033597 [Potamilus streckersoni]|uniref:acylglycerol lipase n=1 Tax=Potamilus streckersoni TaxID=2493646 RepID=A0AAE0T0C3_9BIVA|nr:hypothetical protein CHS0354_033597 [Potamilus streckersoni]
MQLDVQYRQMGMMGGVTSGPGIESSNFPSTSGTIQNIPTQNNVHVQNAGTAESILHSAGSLNSDRMIDQGDNGKSSDKISQKSFNFNTNSINTGVPGRITLKIDRPISSEEKLLLSSPTRFSTFSEGIESSSGVQISVPTQIKTDEMDAIGEDAAEEQKTRKEMAESLKSHLEKSRPKSSKSPRKTHRPISARDIPKHSLSHSSAHAGASSSVLQRIPPDFLLNDTVLFFIHGVGGSSEVWRAQLDFFTKFDVEIIAPDLIGHGDSCAPYKPEAYHFQEICTDLEEIFDRYCKRQNVIIAHSYGSAFAAVLGRKREKRVSKLVLINGGGPTPLEPQRSVFSLPVCMLSCLMPCLFSKFEKRAFHDSTKALESAEQALDVLPHVLTYTMRGQYWMEGDELYHNWLSMRTLLIYGRHDQFVSLEEEQEMERTIFKSKLEVIENASHMVMMEAPDEVNKLLYDFIFHDQVGSGTHGAQNRFEIEDHGDESCSPTWAKSQSKSMASVRSYKSAKSLSKTMR